MSTDPKPVDPTKPDLEDSTNVAKAHEEVIRSSAASSREQQLRENGLEPVSIWVMVAGFIVAIVGGSVLLSSDNLFSYDSFTKENYVRGEFEGSGDNRLLATAADAYMKKGAAKYAGCIGCHGADGSGIPGTYPPLAGSEWVTGSGKVPALVVLHGLKGPISVAGKDFNSTMPSQADGWSDFELASLLYYIQNSFGNNVGEVFSPEQIAEIREISKSHGKNATTAADLEKHLNTAFKAKGLTPETMLDVKTGEVVDAGE